MAIQELDLEIEYRPGKENGQADALSRYPISTQSEGPTETVPVLVSSIQTEIQSGEETEIQSGEETEIQSGEETEIQSGEETEIQSGEETEIQSGEETEIQSGEETEIQSGEETEIQSREETEIQSGEETEIQSGEETEIQSGEETEIQSGEETEIQSREETEIQSGEETEIQSGEETEIQSGEETEIQSGEETEIQSGEETEIQSGEETEIQSGEETEIQSGEETEIQSREETEIQSGEETEIQSGEETEIQSGEETEIQSGEETEIQSGEETEIQSGEETEIQSGEETEIQSREETEIQTTTQETVTHGGETPTTAAAAVTRDTVITPTTAVTQDTVVTPTTTVIQDTVTQDGENTAQHFLSEQQYRDPELRKVIQYLQSGVLPEDDVEARNLTMNEGHSLVDGVLYHLDADKSQIIPPTVDRETLFREAHQGVFSGHLREATIHSQLARHYWWPRMRRDIAHWCRDCLTCASRYPGRPIRPHFTPIPVSGPFDRVGVDVLQLPKTKRGNRYAVVFIDYLTKWPEVYATQDQTTPTIAKLLVEGINKPSWRTQSASVRSWTIVSVEVNARGVQSNES